MILRHLFGAILLILSLASNAQKLTHIRAHIGGLKSDSVFVLIQPFNKNAAPKWDTLCAKEDEFRLRLSLDSVAELIIIPQQMIFHLASGRKYMPPTGFMDLIVFAGDSIIIKGSIGDNYLDYGIQGSSLNSKAAAIRTSYKTLNQRAAAFEVQMANLPNDSSKSRKSKALFNQRLQLTGQISQIKKDYILSHPDDNLSAIFVLKQPINNFEDLYNKLTDRIKNGPFKHPLNNQYQEYLKFMQANENTELITIDKEAPDFSLAGLDGTTFRLSSIKNKSKIIVLDFWGSWCSWCITEFPKMKSFYNKRKEKLTIIGIACNDKEQNWKRAVKAHSLPWINLLNTESQDVSVKYGIKAFPTKIILDQQLKIIGIYKGATPAFFEALDQLLQK